MVRFSLSPSVVRALVLKIVTLAASMTIAASMAVIGCGLASSASASRSSSGSAAQLHPTTTVTSPGFTDGTRVVRGEAFNLRYLALDLDQLARFELSLAGRTPEGRTS